jgi:hypothetical protein
MCPHADHLCTLDFVDHMLLNLFYTTSNNPSLSDINIFLISSCFLSFQVLRAYCSRERESAEEEEVKARLSTLPTRVRGEKKLETAKSKQDHPTCRNR